MSETILCSTNVNFSCSQLNIPNNTSVEFVCESYKLELLSAFGTAHSSSVCRTNVLMNIRFDKSIVGVGEIGLPPKKPRVYLATIDSCVSFARKFIAKLNEDFESWREMQLNKNTSKNNNNNSIFDNIPTEYFTICRQNNDDKKKINLNSKKFQTQTLIQFAFYCLDSIPLSDIDRAAKHGIESALFDAWAQLYEIPLFQFIFGDNGTDVKKPLYYTVGRILKKRCFCKENVFLLIFFFF